MMLIIFAFSLGKTFVQGASGIKMEFIFAYMISVFVNPTKRLSATSFSKSGKPGEDQELASTSLFGMFPARLLNVCPS